jgi:hypothetical protein
MPAPVRNRGHRLAAYRQCSADPRRRVADFGCERRRTDLRRSGCAPRDRAAPCWVPARRRSANSGLYCDHSAQSKRSRPANGASGRPAWHGKSLRFANGGWRTDRANGVAAAEQADEADEAFGGTRLAVPVPDERCRLMPASARDRGHRLAAYPRCSTDPGESGGRSGARKAQRQPELTIMQFDPWTFEPPLGEFSRAIGWFCAVACVLGWTSCAWTLLRRKTTSTDWVLWRRAILAGAVVGVGFTLVALHRERPDPFIAVLFDWIIGSAFAASILMLVWRGAERRALGRRMVEAVALFVLGLPVPAVLAGAAMRLAGR